MAITDVRGILALLAEPALRDELDRVAAAVGVRVVHAGSALPVSRKAWSAALAVVLDESAAQGCAVTGLPRRAHVIVVAGTDPAPTTWAAAIDVGAQHVLKLPAQEHDLVRELADAGDSARDDGAGGPVVAVIGGGGGGGGPPFAGAAGRAPHCSRSRWRRLRAIRCWSTSIPGPAASICWSAPKRRPACAGPIWRCRAVG